MSVLSSVVVRNLLLDESSFMKFQPKIQTLKHKIIILLFAVAGPVFLVGSAVEGVQHKKLVDNGIKTTAKVLGASIEHPHRGPDRARVKVSYAAGKAQQQGTIYMDSNSYDLMDNPTTLPVIYAKDNPQSVELLNGGSDAWLGVLIGLFMTVLGGWGLAPTFAKKAPQAEVAA